jgi:hypothetical protein
MRKLFHGTQSYANILMEQVTKAKASGLKVGGFPAVVNTFTEARSVDAIGLKGALEVKGGGDDPLSVFSLPKLLRCAARTGIQQVWQVDIVNSHFCMMHRRLAPGEAPTIRRVALDRAGVMSELQEAGKAFGVDRAACKRALLSVAYGASMQVAWPYGEVPACLRMLKDEVLRLAVRLAVQDPDLFAKVKAFKLSKSSEKKQNVHICMLSYLNGAEQRAVVDKLISCLPPDARVFSYERDGFVYHGPRVDVAVFAQAGGVPVTVEAYPSEAEVLAGLREKWPHLDWSVQSRIDPFDLVRSMRCSLAALEVLDANGKLVTTISNHSDFASCVAAELETFMHIGSDKTEYFDTEACKYGIWTELSSRQCKAVVRDVLLKLWRHPKRYELSEGKWRAVGYYGDTPPHLKKTNTQNSIIEQALHLLCRPATRALDSPDTRRYLCDRDGKVYDYETDTFISTTIDLRISQRLPWSFDAEKPQLVWPFPAGVTDCLEKIYQYYYAQPDLATASLESDAVFGKPLANAMRHVADGVPVLRLLLDTFSDDVDEALYMLHVAAACSCAWANRCEYTYTYGPANSGKDTLHSLLIHYLGEGSKGGYSAVLPSRYLLASKHARDPEAPTSVLETLRGARYVANNEIPEHREFAAAFMNSLVEQKGTGQISRKMRENAGTLHLTAGFGLTSNHPIQLAETEREPTSGTSRRLVVICMPRTWPVDGEIDVKDRIYKGEFNKQLFALCRFCYRHIKALGGRKRIAPMPPRFLADTKAALEGEVHRSVQIWIERNSIPAGSYATASSQKSVRAALQSNLEITGSMDAILAAAGLKSKRSGTARVFLYEYPAEARSRAIALKPEGEWVQI